MSNKKLMGLKMKVRSALYERAQRMGNTSGNDWKVGRLFNECVYKNRRLKDMTAAECELALKELRKC